jgi:MoxR-like ATPase
VETSGEWPRQWPQHFTAGLPPFALKRKEYKNSFVLREFVGPLAPQINEITDALLKVIQEFLALQKAPIHQVGIDNAVLTDFHEQLNDAGLTFPQAMTERLAASLLCKRFCIFTGLAGSGKTKLAEAFAMWLTDSDDQYRVVAVGADWTSNQNLLGYADALRDGDYQLPANGVLDLIIKADGDKERPYFLILDEMNLSHVERYFADFLSAMESANSTLRLHGVVAGLKAGATTVPHELALPDNLFIIGTVNVDETTYMFSPKVLDRANVIEFRATHDQMAAFLDDPAGINLHALTAQGAAFAQAFVQRSKADAEIATLVDDAGTAQGPQLKLDLLALFTALAEIGAEFGFRTAKEIARFMVIHKELSGTSWQYKDALDAQVLQKLMPKLHGSTRKLDGVLSALGAFATTNGLPLTLEKVNRMQERLKRDGFTSFAEA